jgi:hypothetical protein
MSTDVNYSIKGTTDVPQQVDKSKAAMSSFERQSAAVQKKFSEFGKDVFMSFAAPMVLLHSAINFISASIENRKRQVQEALDFANTAEAKLYASNQEIEAAQRRKEQQKAEEDKKTAEKMKLEARTQFFTESPEGRAMVDRILTQQSIGMSGMSAGTGMGSMGGQGVRLTVEDVAKSLAESNEKMSPKMQAAFDKFFSATAEQRAKKEAEDAASKQASKVPQLFAGDNSVFGIGNSPQMNILNAQVELQKQANEYLAVIAASAGGQADFTKDQTGGMASQVNYKDYTKTV